jgi:SsrA-binding protein
MADILNNPKARRDYPILETFEAGIVLHGTEVKALRVRKLLLHKAEIRKLFGLSSVEGNALFPLSFYWKNGRVKVALAVGKGKLQYDKRDDLKKRDSDRELKRAAMHRLKRK